MDQPFSVAALIIVGPRILAVSRKTDHNDMGLPGGKLDPGETPEQALYREVREETTLQLQGIVPIFDAPDNVPGMGKRICRTYLVTSFRGQPKSPEGAKVAWVPFERVLADNCSFQEYNQGLWKVMREVVPNNHEATWDQLPLDTDLG